MQNEYLVTEVMTASPQKLHLMLVDAAIRQCDRARRLWSVQPDESGEAICKAQEIVGELLAGLNFYGEPEIAGRIAALYTFIFRSLVDAHVSRNETKLLDAARVLGVERETWRRLAELAAGEAGSGPQPQQAPPPPRTPIIAFAADAAPTERLSFQA